VDKTAREVLALQALAATQADEAEVVVRSSAGGLARFSRDLIHQNLAAEGVIVGVRAVSGGRIGTATTTGVDPAALRDAAERAVRLAALAPCDERFPGLPTALPARISADGFSPATASAAPVLRAGAVDAALAIARRERLWAAGYFATAASGVTIANSKGTMQSFDGTEAVVNVKQNAPSSSGFAEAWSFDVARIDAAERAEVAARKALESAAPRAVEPGPWTVILEPPAFGELLTYLADHFSAQSLEEGSSFLCDGFDRPYAAASFTLTDDWSHPLAPSMPFDFEGSPTQRVVLIERGAGKAVVTDSRHAARLGRPNTGHAQLAPNAEGPQATHLVVAPGTRTIEALIASTGRGLLVSRFWYIRTVDRRRTIVTGMTRDGTFLIERGEITCGVRNLRFNQSILEALSAIELGSEQTRTGGYNYSMVVPAAKIEGFTFTSVTDF
jgi:predicted Zn-dependent protease